MVVWPRRCAVGMGLRTIVRVEAVFFTIEVVVRMGAVGRLVALENGRRWSMFPMRRWWWWTLAVSWRSSVVRRGVMRPPMLRRRRISTNRQLRMREMRLLPLRRMGMIAMHMVSMFRTMTSMVLSILLRMEMREVWFRPVALFATESADESLCDVFGLSDNGVGDAC